MATESPLTSMRLSVVDRLRGFRTRHQASQEHRQRFAGAQAQVLRDLDAMRGLLRDPRYERYAVLLREARESHAAEREGYLAQGPSRHAEVIANLTGKIEQLDWILKTPERFEQLSAWLAESQAQQGELDPTTPRGGVSPA